MDGIPRGWLERFLDLALEEDLGLRGDLTSEVSIPETRRGSLRFEARETGILAGATLLSPLAARFDPSLDIKLLVAEGSSMKPMQVFARLQGTLRSLLSLERIYLNLTAWLSGIATETRRYVDLAEGRVKIADTRKTTPLLRPLEKYAVRVGGGVNHRFGLHDAAMIKDNHRAGARADLTTTVRQAREKLGHSLRLIVEVESMEQAQAAIEGGADVLLLDNQTPAQLRELARLWGDQVVLEASGGITLETVAEYSRTGVHLLSTSAPITRSRWLDFGAELDIEA
jgi:nicotinate-nucleotide pyrophosphorylase (carboxylating)